MTIAQALEKLERSPFRRRFHLSAADRAYIRDKGLDTVERHGADFIRQRLAPAHIPNDGRQTPMKGHPIFVAQHATACCCRGCLYKWHKIAPGTALTAAQQAYIVGMLLYWLRHEMGCSPVRH